VRPFLPSLEADSYERRWEPYWLAAARSVTGGGGDTRALQRLRPAVAALSELYTRDRDAVSRAMYEDPALRAAYGLFFFPRTYARMRLVLEELTGRCGWSSESSSPLRLLDLGCGPGASTFALMDHFAGRNLAVTALDQSEPHLENVRTMFARQKPGGVRLTTRRGDLRRLRAVTGAGEGEGGGWDLITLGFALGEAFRGAPQEAVEAVVTEWLGRLRPGGLVVLVEPALQETAERLERLRDRFLAEGRARVLAPCPHAAGCPLLAEGRFWCHEVRKWQAPRATEYLNRTLHRQIQLLKYSFLILGAGGPPGAAGGSGQEGADGEPCEGRLVSPVAKVAGRLVFSLCANDGRVHIVDAQTRDLDPAIRRRLARVERGSWMRFERLERLASGRHYRIGAETIWTVG